MVNCNSCCPTKQCVDCDFITNVVVKPGTCEGLLTFGPDLYTCPGTTASENTEICALDVNVLTNCKGDLKLTLLDDNGCNLDTLVLRCSQYDVSAVSSLLKNPAATLYANEVAQGYTDVVTINANNLNLIGQYVEFEEAAYFNRQVNQTYQNLWCGAEQNGIICQILGNVSQTVQDLSNNQSEAQRNDARQIFSLGQDLIKARVVALKQLCECGKVCNDQFFPIKTTPCQALKGCCPPRH
jgi:hypothetical protein